MNQNKVVTFLGHLLFVSTIVFIVISNDEISADSLKLYVYLDDKNEARLKWNTIIDANYYKVYRAKVDTDVDPLLTKNIKFTEFGRTEINNFIDKYIISAKLIRKVNKPATYFYYVTAIDVWEKIMNKSEIVKLSISQ